MAAGGHPVQPLPHDWRLLLKCLRQVFQANRARNAKNDKSTHTHSNDARVQPNKLWRPSLGRGEIVARPDNPALKFTQRFSGSAERTEIWDHRQGNMLCYQCKPSDFWYALPALSRDAELFQVPARGSKNAGLRGLRPMFPVASNGKPSASRGGERRPAWTRR